MTQKIAVIGSGTMGNGIAHSFAQFGFQVSVVDVSEEKNGQALATITKNMDRMIQKKALSAKDRDDSLSRINFFTSMEAAVTDADLVVEAASENAELKLSLFRQLDSLCKPSCVLASNTSSISITKIAASTKRPELVVGMHFMNPVPLMKLVEIISGLETSADTINLIQHLSERLEKIPVVVHDYPGFIANRILMPMINEAIYALHEGVAGIEEIDSIMKLGMAHPMGPFQLADFIGLDTCLSILEVLHSGFKNPKYAPCPLLVNLVAAGHLGMKSEKGFYTYTAQKKEGSPNNLLKRR